uniref:Calpain_III domain-containing protein n=1 Tax=Panagrellus redivivus TaxID=6233 RepID=A0A7E4UM03_PANRE
MSFYIYRILLDQPKTLFTCTISGNTCVFAFTVPRNCGLHLPELRVVMYRQSGPNGYELTQANTWNRLLHRSREEEEANKTTGGWLSLSYSVTFASDDAKLVDSKDRI